MRRAIMPKLSLFNRLVMPVTPMMTRTVSTPNMETKTVNFDGYFETFNKIYAPDVKTIIKKWNREGDLPMYGNIDKVAEILTSIRKHNIFPIFGENHLDAELKNYVRFQLFKIDHLFRYLNDCSILFGGGQLTYDGTANPLPHSSQMKKIKLFQYSLFHLATMIETELLGRDLTKPGDLVTGCYWPEQFYGESIIEEFRAQHSGLLMIDQKDLINNPRLTTIVNSNTIMKADTKSATDCNSDKPLGIFSGDPAFYRFLSILRFLVNCNKRPLSESAAEYYECILVDSASRVRRNLINRMYNGLKKPGFIRECIFVPRIFTVDFFARVIGKIALNRKIILK